MYSELKAKPKHSLHFDSAVLQQLQTLIAEFIIDEPANILPQLELDTDLGIDPAVAFPKLIAQVNDEFDIQLNAKHLAEDMEISSVADLATIISDETELG